MNAIDKAWHKELCEDFQHATGKPLNFVRIGRMTFLYWFTGPDRGFITWAICAKDEPKDTRKRGELAALLRWNGGGALPFEGNPELLAKCICIAQGINPL